MDAKAAGREVSQNPGLRAVILKPRGSSGERGAMTCLYPTDARSSMCFCSGRPDVVVPSTGWKALDRPGVTSLDSRASGYRSSRRPALPAA